METSLGTLLAEQFDSDAIEQIIAACDEASLRLRDRIEAIRIESASGPYLKQVKPFMEDDMTFRTISAHLRSLRI